VAQVVEQPRFALEGFEQVWLVNLCLFEGDGAAEALVSRHVDHTHPALSNLFLDEIAILQKCARSNHIEDSSGLGDMYGEYNGRARLSCVIGSRKTV
jgi:hypothetical protein